MRPVRRRRRCARGCARGPAPDPSLKSIAAGTGRSAARRRPSGTRAFGRKNRSMRYFFAATNLGPFPRGLSAPASRRQPSAASPTVPVTKISSPTRAVSRRMTPRPASPSSATVIAEFARASDVSPDDVGTSRARRSAEPGVDSLEQSCVRPVTHRQIYDAGGRPPSHRRDVAQVDGERVRAQRFRRAPSRTKCTPSTMESMVKSMRRPRGPKNRAVVAGAENRARPLGKRGAQSRNQFEFAKQSVRARSQSRRLAADGLKFRGDGSQTYVTRVLLTLNESRTNRNQWAIVPGNHAPRIFDCPASSGSCATSVNPRPAA